MKTVSVTTFKQVLTEIKAECIAQGWTSVSDVTKSDTYRDIVLQNINGMYVSLSEGYQTSTSSTASKTLILPNFFETFNAALPLSSNVGAFQNNYILSELRTNVPILKCINNSMTLFLFITALSIRIVIKVDQNYSFLYIGEGNRIGTYEQYKNPWICGGNTWAEGSSSVYFGSMFREQITQIKNINNLNQNISLRYPSSTISELDNLNQVILVPYYFANTESFVVLPTDCFFISSVKNLISENVLTYNSVEYMVFRSSISTDNYNNAFIAIKK